MTLPTVGPMNVLWNKTNSSKWLPKKHQSWHKVRLTHFFHASQSWIRSWILYCKLQSVSPYSLLVSVQSVKSFLNTNVFHHQIIFLVIQYFNFAVSVLLSVQVMNYTIHLWRAQTQRHTHAQREREREKHSYTHWLITTMILNTF